jgi:O-antigen ligase
LVVGIVSGGWLWSKPAYWTTAWERRIFGLIVVFLFIAIHIFSVRSALIALYTALGFTVARYLYLTRQWKVGLLALVLLAAVPIVAINTVDSLKQRLAYMLYDWQHFRSAGGGENYSDSERFVSLEVGARIWADHRWLGVGVGDLEKATLAKTQEIYPTYAETPKLPHNQFIYIMAATGILGLLLSLWALLSAVRHRRYRGFYLFAVFQTIVFISFLVEYTLETAIGAAFYLFYQLWWMHMADGNPTLLNKR